MSIVRTGRPRREEALVAEAALDIVAIEDEQEHDELHPAERLVEPLTHLVYAMVSEQDPYKRESHGERAIFYVHAIHDHLVAANADNHDATGCAYCLIRDQAWLRPEAAVAGQLAQLKRRSGSK